MKMKVYKVKKNALSSFINHVVKSEAKILSIMRGVDNFKILVKYNA